MAVVRGFRFGGWDWEGLDEFLQDEADDLNRDYFDVMELGSSMRSDIEPWSSGKRHSLLLVAMEGERVLGIAAIRRGATDRDRHVGMLRLHVRKEYRSNGVGAKLLRRALWWADRNGITRTVAMPYIDSGPLGRVMHELKHGSIAFFKRHGFRPEGLQRQAARLLDGTYTDVALMARVIPAKEEA